MYDTDKKQAFKMIKLPQLLLFSLSCSESDGKAQSGNSSAKLTPGYCGLFIT